MKILQQLLHFIYRHFFCWHNWVRLKHYNLPNEPYLMECKKCGMVVKSNLYLDQKLTNSLWFKFVECHEDKLIEETVKVVVEEMEKWIEKQITLGTYTINDELDGSKEYIKKQDILNKLSKLK